MRSFFFHRLFTKHKKTWCPMTDGGLEPRARTSQSEQMTEAPIAVPRTPKPIGDSADARRNMTAISPLAIEIGAN
jgi:hypothetical protein